MMMDTKNFHLLENLKGLKIDDDKDINILLLGQSGIGKSTLINSVINYMSFKEVLQAEHKLDKLSVLIPSQFGISNKDNEMEEVRIGETEADDDDDEIGEFATQDVKSYLFTVPIGNYKIKVKLVDSPGIGDSRGLIQDAENIDKILSYIGQLDEIHAICLVFNPTNTRITAFFEYCLQEILSRLNKSASKNLVFIFTSTKGTNFTPGDTFPLLRKIRDKIRAKNDVDILLDQNENVFCFENDAFKYLAAMKQGVAFSKEQRREYLRSWNHSCKECLRLISYIVGDEKRPPLAPHSTQGTISINEARRLITNLSQPLADISQLIQSNINVLQRHQCNLSLVGDSVNDLNKLLYIPVINLKVINLTQPVTVCVGSECTTNVVLDGEKLKYFKEKCHDPCFLKGIQREIVGDPRLLNCDCIDKSTKACIKCCCDFSVHMHVYYLTEPVTENRDAVVKRDVSTREEALMTKNAIIMQIEQRRREYEKERERIVVCAAQFAHFLQHNAITPINDCYETYIRYLIRREESSGAAACQKTLNHLNNTLESYRTTKHELDRSLEIQKQTRNGNIVNPETIDETIRDLYRLKHTGAKIQELIEKQLTARKIEHDHFDTTVDVSCLLKMEKKGTGQSSGKKAEKKRFYNRGRDRQNFNRSDNGELIPNQPPPPPPYESHQSHFPIQQSLFQTAPGACYSDPGSSFGPNRCLGVEVIINQDPLHHQCVSQFQPPHSRFPGPQAGYVEPQSGYPGSKNGYPGYTGGPQGPQGGFAGNIQGNQEQNSWGFHNQNKQNRNNYPQSKQGGGGSGGPKFNNSNQNRNWQPRQPQKDPKFQNKRKFYNNKNRNTPGSQQNNGNVNRDQEGKLNNNQNRSGGAGSSADGNRERSEVEGQGGLDEIRVQEGDNRRIGGVRRGRRAGSSESTRSDTENRRRTNKEILIDCCLIC